MGANTLIGGYCAALIAMSLCSCEDEPFSPATSGDSPRIGVRVVLGGERRKCGMAGNF